MKLDKTEATILRALQLDGRMSNVELAELVGLSESPCFRRVRRLEQAGVISGYSARLNQRALGLQVTAFVQVSLDKQNDAISQAFTAAVAGEDYIVECHAMSGSYDFLLKVVTYSMDHFSEVAMRRILRFPGVNNIESNFSLGLIKANLGLPVSIRA